MQEYCNFTLDQPVVDLKLVAPISRELFVVEANSNLGQGACAAIYTLAAQDLRIFARLAIKAAVGELSVLGCRAPQPREGNLATCQGLEHVNNFKTSKHS